jgi:hypothetical protein
VAFSQYEGTRAEGLMSYGPYLADVYARTRYIRYADQILNREKPVDLPAAHEIRA